MIILGVDSSSRSASAAVLRDDVLLSEVFVNTGLTHSQTLIPLINEALQNAKIDVNDLNLIAVSNGPGSFTGVRIGVSAVKGIAFTNNIKCCAISTLEALSENLKCFNGIICSVLDARCNQVYYALFESDGRNIKRLCDDEAIGISELEEKIKKFTKNIIFVGDGAELCYNEFKDKFDNVYLSEINSRFLRASSVAASAIGKNEFICAEELLPSYLRLPQAQRNLKKSLEG